MSGTAQTQACPRCGQPIGQNPGFYLWCPACEWNLDPDPPQQNDKKRHAFRQVADRAGDRLARRLYEQVRKDPPGSRGGLALAAFTSLLAAFIHLLTLVTAAAGVLLLVPGFGLGWPVRVIGAVLLCGTALFIQPFRRRRRHGRLALLRRGDAPALFALVDEVAASIGAPPVSSVVLTAEFNASYFKLSFRRPAIGLGLTLWSVLQPQERVALLGHELGHRINGDLRKTSFVGRAITSLRNWRMLLEPGFSPTGRLMGGGMTALAELIMLLILIPLALLVETFGNGLELIANRQGQRSEYYADELSALAAGTKAAVTLLEKMLIGQSCLRVVHQNRSHHQDVDVWLTVRQFADSVPELEWRRRILVATRKLQRIDTTHPPTQLRADLLRERPAREAAVVLDATRSGQIDAELAPLSRAIARSMR